MKRHAGLGGRVCVCWVGGRGWGYVCLCVFTVESGCLQITCHPFDMAVLPTGLLSVCPWEWHMEAANFCLPETQSESQGAPLKMRRMRCLPSSHHNGAQNMQACKC